MRNLVLYTLFSILSLGLYSQQYLGDTIFISFDTVECKSFSNISVKNVYDERSLTPHTWHIDETTKYLVVPVDQYYQSREPFSSIIENLLCSDEVSPKHSTYDITINEFSLETRKQLFFPGVVLNAWVVAHQPDGRKDSAALIYEMILGKSSMREKDLSGTIKKAAKEWAKQLQSDLTVLSVSPEIAGEIIPNIRNAGFSFKKRLESSLLFGVGLSGFLMDAEIGFSRPEAGNFFVRSPQIIRFRDTEKFQSLEFGIDNEHFNFRINDQMLFSLQSKLMLGINRFKDMGDEEHGLEEVLLLDYSLHQILSGNNYARHGLFGGFGIYENLYYYYNELFFDAGLMVNLGIRF